MTDETAENLNSYTDFAGALMGGADIFGGSQLSSAASMFKNNRWYLISNFRQLLSEMYVEHGVIQTLIDQPVDDGFRSGFEIKSSQLDANDIEKIMNWMERNRTVEKIKQACKWARLYGGGALIPLTNQKPSTQLNYKAIGKDTPLDFRAVDMWELYDSMVNLSDHDITADDLTMRDEDRANYHYNFYGIQLDRSRVWRVEGKEAPSFIRPRLRGWGMSEVERVVRSFNQYLKNQDVAFELMDEAKVDVYKIKGFNAALINKEGTQRISNRVQLANMVKNYLNALTMDMEDDYQQKQVQFTGLADMLPQIRMGIAADLKMPMTKLWGISAAGFNSGEDDIENYNSMIESEVRSKVRFMVIDVVGLISQKLFGIMPDDLMIQFNPLRILNAKEEEEVKNHQFNRTLSAYSAGLIEDKEAKQAINRDSLLPIEINENTPALPPLGQEFDVTDGENVDK